MVATDEMRRLGVGMSNYDHRIEDWLEPALRAEPNGAYAQYTGWDFHARVWFDGEQFAAGVRA